MLIRMLRLRQEGYSCSQILLLLALDMRGEENPGLVRAMAGLAYGCGAGAGTCGALTGGCCLLALYAGKGGPEEEASDQLAPMLQDLSEWFTERVGGQYGGIECHTILGGKDPSAAGQPCATVVSETWAKAMEILLSYGLDPSGAP
jgi:hypothetical protein